MDGAARSDDISRTMQTHEAAPQASLADDLPGPTRPDMVVIWPLESGFGIDVSWMGREGSRRATVVQGMLEDASIKARLTQHPDGRRWELRVGPVDGTEVARLIDNFVW